MDLPLSSFNIFLYFRMLGQTHDLMSRRSYMMTDGRISVVVVKNHRVLPLEDNNDLLRPAVSVMGVRLAILQPRNYSS
jgi:hypothetical protein